MINIICFNNKPNKEVDFLVNDYIKRINRYHKLNIIYLKEQNSLKKEAELINKFIKEKSYIIVCDPKGKMYTSEDFSSNLINIFNNYPNIYFIIGSSNGIDESIKKIAKESISFSKLTFPNQLFRIFLVEQIYRGFKINNNEVYHK